VRAHVLVTTRAGGVSAPPYDSLNLARHVGDDPADVTINRGLLDRALRVERTVFMQQAHRADVGVVDEAPGGDVEAVDALVTRRPGLALAVLVADCVPVAVTGSSSLAVVHAGRRGVQAGVVAAAVAALRGYDDGPLAATIGPAVCGRCYEVPAPMQAEVVAVAPAAECTTSRGTAGLDLPAAVTQQLVAAGVDRIERDPRCTVEDHALFSHRRDGVTGRFAVAAVLRG
jgi:polyphenol oxidase